MIPESMPYGARAMLAAKLVGVQQDKIQQIVQEYIDKWLKEQEMANTPTVIPVEGLMVIDPVVATSFLNDWMYPRQRRLRQDHVDQWVLKMQQGLFQEKRQIAFGKLNNRYFLVDGQHRMSAVSQSGEKFEFNVLVTVVNSERELDSLYWSFDRSNLARTNADVLNAADIQSKYGVRSKSLIRTVFNSYMILSGGFTELTYDKERNDDKRLEFLHDWWPAAVKLEQYLDRAPTHVRKRFTDHIQITSVALATIKFQPEKAEKFWLNLCLDDGLRQGDPRKTLLGGLFNPENKVKWKKNDLDECAHAISAWNAFYKNPEKKHTYTTNATLKIEGTPFKGR